MKYCIVLPFFNTPMWGQTVLYRLIETLKLQDKHEFEILVVDNATDDGIRSLKKEYIYSLSGVDFFHRNNIRFIKNPEENKYHGTALDIAVRKSNADFLVCWETDILPLADNWFDWLISFIDDDCWMVGYEWDFNNILDSEKPKYFPWYCMPNPGIYRMDILKEIDKEVQENKSSIHYYGKDFSKTGELEIKYNYGVFSERRGFKETHPDCSDGSICVRENIAHYENGQWLFFRMQRDPRKLFWIPLPVTRKVRTYNGELAPEYANFNDYFKHYWAGTRCWDFLLHPEANRSQINYIQEKIQLEIDLWKQYVPLNIRKVAVEIMQNNRNDDYELNNIYYLHNNENNRTSKITGDWVKSTFYDSNFESLL